MEEMCVRPRRSGLRLALKHSPEPLLKQMGCFLESLHVKTCRKQLSFCLRPEFHKKSACLSCCLGWNEMTVLVPLHHPKDGARDTAHAAMPPTAVTPSSSFRYHSDKYPHVLFQLELVWISLAQITTDHTGPLSASTLKSCLPLCPVQAPRVLGDNKGASSGLRTCLCVLKASSVLHRFLQFRISSSLPARRPGFGLLNQQMQNKQNAFKEGNKTGCPDRKSVNL